MFRKTILCALAGAATIMTGAAVAKPGGGGGHGMGALHANAHGLAVAPHGLGVRPARVGRIHSQGPYHASATGILHSNSHSVLKGTTVVGGSLDGLTRGMTVVDINGNTVGTVRGINAASGGRVVNVLVKSSTSARTIPLSPKTISVTGGVATTTSLRRHSG
jgi:hypothetical protein